MSETKPAPPTPRFEDVTETTGIPISAEGAQMMYTRYRFATEFAAGARTLEIGCAAGQGLGLLSRSARGLVGGDFSRALLQNARQQYGTRVPLVRFSADQLPFVSESFDLVLFFEVSYYVPNMSQTFEEIARVLSPGGTALFVNANPERPDFIRSPYSVHYHTADEFRFALGPLGLDVTVEGVFPVQARKQGVGKLAGWALSAARRVLEGTGVIPRTLRGRARLKRLVYGKLLEVPAELPQNFAPVAPRACLAVGPVRDYKVIYVTARKRTREV